MNKQEWLRYNAQILGKHDNNTVSEYMNARRDELASKFAQAVRNNDIDRITRIVSLLIGHVAGDEAVMLSINKLASSNVSSSRRIKAVKVCAGNYIDKIVNDNNETLDKFKNKGRGLND